MRDKLIELLEDLEQEKELLPNERAADYLIQNGVTFADVPDNNVGDKPLTNGDRIRAMTDEELCDFILDKRENGNCFNDKCYHNDPDKGCDDCTLEWLKQPAR